MRDTFQQIRCPVIFLLCFALTFQPALAQLAYGQSCVYYDDNDQLYEEVTDGVTTSYWYDLNGSLTQKSVAGGDTTIYSYNLQNRLSPVTVGSNPAISYEYNPDGIRVQKKVGTDEPIKYIIDSFNHTGYAQVFRANILGGASTVYILGNDVLAQATGAANPEYLLFDGHSSVRQLANNNGAIVENYNYDGYGNAHGFEPADAATNLLYAGEQFDTHLAWYYNRVRYYNPATGRFNRMDPFSGNNHDPQSLHKYLYCHANPANRVDPKGLMSLLSTTITSAIMGALIGGLIGGIDSALGGESFWKGFGWGALFGGIAGVAAVFLPMTLLVKSILGGLIIATTAVGAISSFMNGYYLQGFFRIIVGLVSLGLLVKVPKGPSIRARVGYSKSLQNLGFTAAEAKALAFGKPVITCIPNPGGEDTLVVSQFANGRLRIGILSIEDTSGTGAHAFGSFRTLAYNIARALGVNEFDMFGAQVNNSRIEAMLMRQGFKPQTWTVMISELEGLQEWSIYVKPVKVP